MFEKISLAITGILVAFFLWVGVSWVDVITDNNKPNPNHSNYNFFVVLTTIWEDNI